MDDDRDVVLGDDDGRGSARARRGAGLYDVLVLGWAVGVLAVPASVVAPALARASLFVLWCVLVVVEGLTGASPGKHVTGLRVARLDGGRADLLAAVRRRPWGWLLPLQFLGDVPRGAATATALVVLVAMLVSVERSPDGRGFHDRLAGTTVVASGFDRRARLVVVTVTAAAALSGLVLAAVVAPVAPA